MMSKTEPSDTRKSMVIKGTLADQIQALAEQEHRSFANIVEWILQKYVDQASEPIPPSVDDTPTLPRK